MKLCIIRTKTGKDWFVCESTYAERDIPKAAHFWWNFKLYPGVWSTNKLEDAILLKDYASPEDRVYLEEKVSSIQQALSASHAHDNTEIQIPAPKGLEYLPFQRAGIAYALTRDKTLLADSMGLGKTIQSIGVINATHPQNVVVVCPATLRLNWKTELEKWLVHPYTIHVVLDNSPIPPEATIIIVNYDRLSHPSLMERHWDILIVDECHKVKNPKALRTQKVLGVEGKYDKASGKTTITKKGLIHNATRALFLTGTPILNRPVELWPIAHALDPKVFSNFWGFAKRYCNATQTRYGWDFSGATHLDELQRELRVSCMIRRLKEEVLTELPPKRRQIIALPPNGASDVVEKEARLYQEAEDQKESLQNKMLLAQLEGDDQGYQEAVGMLTKASKEAFTEISKVRHEVALAKVPATVSFLEDLLENEKKVVVWAHHHDVIQALQEALSEYHPVTLTGETKMEDRKPFVDRFQTDPETKVFIGSITAAGVGITLTAASTVVFVELDWVPANMTQAEDRCHRIGQSSHVVIQHLVLDGSIDQRLAETLVQKQTIADQALDAPLPEHTLDLIAPPVETGLPSIPVYPKETMQTVLEALRALSSVCDGARVKDGYGFNRFDAKLGRDLSQRSFLTDKQIYVALRMLKKYRKQLDSMGISLNS
jgi:SWI/SNF-related matrix-associated actin-dependent regulator 1 of chromatin subfamily A